MSTQQLERKIPAPPINAENQRFFDAAKQGRLLIGLCHACGKHHFYPRTLCPFCFSDRTEWTEAAGTGILYSFSTSVRGVPVPYTIAYVTLDEGITMMTNIVDADPAKLEIGQRLKVVFREAEDGSNIAMFTNL